MAGVIPASQAHHIELNAGNVFAVGLLAVLFVGTTLWATNALSRTEIPVLSQLAIGAQMFFHAA